ncbi:MAG: hypothetical protein KF764_31670 [Labilithrix sp.]|nr:hypothetical protein [Labilithrix sp.]
MTLDSTGPFARTRSLSCFAVFGGGALAAAMTLLACSDDEPSRAAFDDDAGPRPSLPEAGDPADGSAVDARGPFDPRDEAVTCDASPCVTQIVAGDDHFCARIADGTVRCWGDDSRGQLGQGGLPDEGEADKPRVADVQGVTQLSAAGATTCARVDDGGVLCWGSNAHGELGRAIDPPADEDPHPTPERVAIDAAARVDVGPRSVCATTSAGGVSCWGNDESAQLARGEPQYEPGAPAPAELGVAVKRTGAGFDTGFALTADGALLTWGAVAGTTGVLAGRVSSVTPTPVPSSVERLEKITSFAVSGTTPGRLPPDALPWMPPPPPNQHACAVMNGDAFCWGKSERGALGSGLPDSVVPLPTLARLGTRAYAQQIAAGGETTCVRLTDGNVACTGENERGQLGKGAAGPFASTFTAASTLSGRAVQVAVAKETVCALVQGGTVSCWGGNAHGELGLGSRDDDAHPSAAKITF